MFGHPLTAKGITGRSAHCRAAIRLALNQASVAYLAETHNLSHLRLQLHTLSSVRMAICCLMRMQRWLCADGITITPRAHRCHTRPGAQSYDRVKVLPRHYHMVSVERSVWKVAKAWQWSTGMHHALAHVFLRPPHLLQVLAHHMGTWCRTCAARCNCVREIKRCSNQTRCC